MVTARGIYYNLKETLYFYKVLNYKFYFSSKKYRDKFIDLHKNYIATETSKLEYVLNTKIIDSDYLLFKLYGKIEKRGFFIEDIKNQLSYYELPKINLKMEW